MAAVRRSHLPITSVEATPGFIGLLGQIGADVVTDTTVTSGVWLSSDLADMLGATPGGVVQTSAGPAQVAGVYTWPSDGRARDLGYTMVVPVPADGQFSQCWALIWPTNPNLASLPYTSANGDVGATTQVSAGQLNQSLGTDYDASHLLAARTTAKAPWAGVLAGLVIGLAAAWNRRLEIASSLHARVPKPHLIWQHLIETSIWVLAAAFITAAGLLWVSRLGNPDPSWQTWLIGLRTVAAGAAATLIGTAIGAALTKEHALFRFSKDK